MERKKAAERRFESQTMRKRSRQTVGVAGLSETEQKPPILRIVSQSKELPTYFLIETASGYGLVVTHGLTSIVDRDYVAVEKYINQFDQNFKFVAFHHFATTAEALIELKSISKGDVTKLLINFLVQNLPKVANANGKPCYALALADARMVNPIAYKTTVCCVSGVFHNNIMRGVRMNIRKSINPEVSWEKEHMDLVRSYNMSSEILERKGFFGT